MSIKVIKSYSKRTAIALAVTSALTNNAVIAAEAEAQPSDDVEVISVTGMLSSLKRSMLDKKESAVVSDGIAAEDLGKFPDLNVAESLQRITGVSIDRSGGEGQSVTVDGFVSKFEVDAVANDLASWFEPDRVGSATFDAETGTLTSFTQELGLDNTTPASDFVQHTRNSLFSR